MMLLLYVAFYIIFAVHNTALECLIKASENTLPKI